MAFHRLPNGPSTISLQSADIESIFSAFRSPHSRPQHYPPPAVASSTSSSSSPASITYRLPRSPRSPAIDNPDPLYNHDLHAAAGIDMTPSSESAYRTTSGVHPAQPSSLPRLQIATTIDQDFKTSTSMLYGDYLSEYGFGSSFELDSAEPYASALTSPDYRLRSSIGSATSSESAIEKDSFVDSYFVAASKRLPTAYDLSSSITSGDQQPRLSDRMDIDHLTSATMVLSESRTANNQTFSPATASPKSAPLKASKTATSHAPSASSKKQPQQASRSLVSPCLTSATAAAAEEIAASTKRVRRRKNSISEKAAMINPDIRPPLNTIGSRKPLVLPELPPGKTKEDLDPEELAKYKHVHRLLRNRVAALASREKKRLYIEHLEDKVEKLEKEKDELEKSNEDMKKYIGTLEQRASSESVFWARQECMVDGVSSDVIGKAGERPTSIKPTAIKIKKSSSDEKIAEYMSMHQTVLFDGVFMNGRQEFSYSACLSQQDFEQLALSAGLMVLLLYLTVAVKYPSFADLTLRSPYLAPRSIALHNVSSLSYQIYKILSDDKLQQGYIHLHAEHATEPGQHPSREVWLVTKAEVVAEVQEGGILRIVAPVHHARRLDATLGAPPSPMQEYDERSPSSENVLEEIELVVKRRQLLHLTASL
ncbi:hypothetical protein POJ06DRAFT_281472 [Lipomyces tetrasporus]|uniref:BZIP domain-containing protein n=1 Tax=Lipomyces tetrasporus TaxID=54092 RepID=A0AAD7QV88_9ASCO|nr:uncharacterized protein POJ06DRAFT_281472 [Lipomyces tetrasporus]KAJ8100397.1 hypothetical protein POJ06DRAFT_281472 [Lipomyces tetrasporus]